MGQTVGIIGAGAWGTALGISLGNAGHSVEIWAREEDVCSSINIEHENTRFLAGFKAPASLKASSDIRQVAAGKAFLILASPSMYLEQTVREIADVPNIGDGSAYIGILTKGFIPSEERPKLIVEMLEDVLPPVYRRNLVYIAGPSHAEEVAMGKLTGLVAACENPMNSIRFRELLKSKGILAYSSLDVIGVQICAAAKNVIAIAFGILDAISENDGRFGDNTQSLLLAAGLNEMLTLGRAMNASHPETFTSIAGVGDLDVTCRSRFGRNRRFGQEIIKKGILRGFANIDDLIARISEIGYLPEGAAACKYVHIISEMYDLDMPISNGLYRILNKEGESTHFIEKLLEGEI